MWFRRKPVSQVVIYQAADGWRYRLVNGSSVVEGDRGRKQFVYTVRQARKVFPDIEVYQESDTGLSLVK